MNPLMEQMREQLRQREMMPHPKGFVPRGPVSIEDAMRHLWMSPESWLNIPPGEDPRMHDPDKLGDN